MDQIRKGLLVRLAVGVVGLCDLQGERVVAQGSSGLVVAVGDLRDEFAGFGESGLVVLTAVALPLGVLIGPLGGWFDRNEHVVQALELVRVALDEWRAATLQELDVLAVADAAAHRASGATYWP
ncbi:hypothetical protein [Streptomyces sp. NPDC127197]|uniref:hypothetical protein n=1 Tax=Streptomyces sp. NPDC127197 TaxID=3345388 RepID=UPI0036385800